MRTNRFASLAMGVFALATLAACNSPTDVSPLLSNQPALLTAPLSGTPGSVIVCKDGPAGTFNFTVTAGAGVILDATNVTGGQFTLVDEECKLIGTIDPSVNPPVSLSIAETPAAGTEFVQADIYYVQPGATQTGATADETRGNPTGDITFGDRGAVVVFVNQLEPPQEDGCTLTQGYWKNHPEDWDEVADPNSASFITTTTFYNSGESYLTILNTPPKQGNAYLILAHQFIAAQLNLGQTPAPSTTSAVDDALADAAAYFASAPAGIPNPTGSLRDDLIEWADILDDWNNGITGPGHCDDLEELD